MWKEFNYTPYPYLAHTPPLLCSSNFPLPNSEDNLWLDWYVNFTPFVFNNWYTKSASGF